MVPNEDQQMSDRSQITINLSTKALEEFRLVAKWKNIPVATLIRQIVEREHESPSFANLVRRAKSED